MSVSCILALLGLVFVILNMATGRVSLNVSVVLLALALVVGCWR